MRKLLLFFLFLTLSFNAHALKQGDLLHPDKAFQLSATSVDENTIKLTWSVAEGYYLYRDRISFKSALEGITLNSDASRFPTGDMKDDPTFGRMEVYHDDFSVEVPIDRQANAQQAIELAVNAKYQGCADAGVCYPPIRKKITLKLAELASSAISVASANTELADETESSSENKISPIAIAPRENQQKSAPLALLGGLNGSTPLPVEQAFKFSLIPIDKNTLNARWDITPEHHLYRSKINFTVKSPTGAELGDPVFPEGKIVDDEFFGKMEIYDRTIDVSIPIAGGDADELIVETQYQGCANESGICYSPVIQETVLSLAGLPEQTPASPDANGPQSLTGTDNSTNTTLADDYFSGSFIGILFAFFVVGLGLSLTPCIFPMIPILSGIIAGQSNLSMSKAFTLSLIYVVASATAYALIGLVFGFFGENLQSSLQHPIAIGLFAALFVILSLSMFGFFDLQMPSSIQSRLNAISNNQRSGSLLGAAVMGFLSTLIVGPCVAPALAAALTYIANSKDAVLGASALFSMGFGMGVILLVVGTLGGHLLPRAGAWMDTTKAIFGIMLLGMAIWMLSRIVPMGIVMALTGVLLVSSGIYMGALDRLSEEAGGWNRFWKSIGLILLFYGAAQLLGVSAGSNNLLQPLKGVFAIGVASNTATAAQHQEVSFRQIKNVNELDAILQQASQNKQQVMLDFYADWCVDCIRMEKDVFSAPAIKPVLDRAILLQADVTERNEDNRALEKRFGIVGPPTIIFFDKAGQEIKNLRMIGYEGIPEFGQRLQQFLSQP